MTAERPRRAGGGAARARVRTTNQPHHAGGRPHAGQVAAPAPPRRTCAGPFALPPAPKQLRPAHAALASRVPHRPRGPRTASACHLLLYPAPLLLTLVCPNPHLSPKQTEGDGRRGTRALAGQAHKRKRGQARHPASRKPELTRRLSLKICRIKRSLPGVRMVGRRREGKRDGGGRREREREREREDCIRRRQLTAASRAKCTVH